jgi:hypothetical protein
MALAILHQVDAGAVEDPDRVFADIYDMADQLESIARSIREDAYRRNAFWLRMHRPELVQQARLISGLIRDLAPIEGKRAPQ